MKKRIFSMMLALLPIVAFAASALAYITVVNIEEPKPGARPDNTGMAAYYDNYNKENRSIYISKVEWSGRFDANGCFIAGENYKLTVTASIKSSSDNYFGTGMKNLTGKVSDKTIINGKPARVVSVTPKAVKLSYTYPHLGKQAPSTKTISTQAKPKTSATSPKPAAAQTRPSTLKTPALTPPPATSTALLEPVGYPDAPGNGTVDEVLTTLPQSSESKQREWTRARPAIAKLTNRRIVEEYKALKAWEEKANFTITEALDKRKCDLDDEIHLRARTLGKFIEDLQAARKSANETGWVRDQHITALAGILEDDAYKRTIKSSLTPLKPYLSSGALEYFESNGGLENAINGEKTKWEPISQPIIVTTSVEGLTGTVTLNRLIDVQGVYYRLLPKRQQWEHNRATLCSTNPQAVAGKDIVIPSHIQLEGQSYPVTEIQASSFFSNEIKSIVIPNTVKNIGNNAFANLVYVTSIEIPNSVQELGAAVFHSSPELREIHIPNSVRRIGGGCFTNCPKLTTVTLPQRVDHFDLGQFENCPSLVSVTLPENLTSIRDRMFFGCKNLKNIVFPAEVKTIGGWAFRDCTQLTSIVIPPSVTEIAGTAFEGCTRLTSIIIPPSVTKIGWNAFRGCGALKSVTLSSKFKDPKILFPIFQDSGALPRGSTQIPGNFHFTD